jgi:tRNA-Thr(GGU) m(6)t(6)A37 methyltransferase TsaA
VKGDNMQNDEIILRPIGRIESPLKDRETAPKQGDEDAPEAWLVLDPIVRAGLLNLTEGQEVILLTWLDRADRDVLQVHPRGDETRPLCGVFATRSPDRPNPIGLHTIRIVKIDGDRLLVKRLEALDGTPILDIKPLLGPLETR